MMYDSDDEDNAKAIAVVARTAGKGESKNARKRRRRREREREERLGLKSSPSPSSPLPSPGGEQRRSSHPQSDEGRKTPASTEVDGSAKKIWRRRRKKKRTEMAMAPRRLDDDLLPRRNAGGGETTMPSFLPENDEDDNQDGKESDDECNVDDDGGNRTFGRVVDDGISTRDTATARWEEKKEEEEEEEEWGGKARATKSSPPLRTTSTNKSRKRECRAGDTYDVDGEGRDNDDGEGNDGGGWSPIAAMDSVGDEEGGDHPSKSSRQQPRRLHGIGQVTEDGGISARPNAASREFETRRCTLEQQLRRCVKGRDDDDFAENDDDKDNNRGGVSVEVLKRDILGRSIPSIYDSPLGRDLSRGAYESAIRRASRAIVAADGDPSSSAIARRLNLELSCPICHDRLYDPASLLCGHTFCYACLDWWLEARHRTCPSCRDPIPAVPGDSTSNDDSPEKPSIRVNTVLKTVLCVLYPAEMNLRRLAELRLRRRAVGGEANGRHSRGSGVEIEPLSEEGHDELYFLRGESVTNDVDALNRDLDEGNGWKKLYASLNGPGWSSSSLSSSRRHKEGEAAYSRGSGACVMIRRNIVLDEIDQRFQLSLGLTKCTYYPGGANKTIGVPLTQLSSSATSASVAEGVLDIELCLLSMEEDEVDNSGFPAVVKNGDDNEALICAGSDHRMHTCIDSSMRVVPHSLTSSLSHENNVGGVDVVFSSAKGGLSSALVQEIPLSGGMIGRDGTVRFRIDIKAALKDAMKTMTKNDQDDDEEDDDSDMHIRSDYDNGLHVVKLIFRHGDTGAVLELRLPSRSDIDGMMQKCSSEGKIEFCGDGHAPLDEDDPSRYFLDDLDDKDDDVEPNEYEDDGFVVNGSQDSYDDKEREFDSVGEQNYDDDDDYNDDVCQICKNGGELVVCDGGDHPGGCGHMYHVHCIARTAVPPGDWICTVCAEDIGLNVGIEGYEYVGEVGAAAKIQPPVIDDSDDNDDDIIPYHKTKKKNNRKILHTPDSDSDSA